MLIYKLLWAGAALLAGSEVMKFLGDQREEPKALPSGAGVDEPPAARSDEDEDEDEEITTIQETLAERRAAAEAQEIAESDHTITFTVGGLVVACLGGLIHPSARLLSVPFFVTAVIPPIRRAWKKSRERGALTYAGLELAESSSQLALGQTALSGGGWLLFSSGARVLLATRRRTKEAIREISMAEEGQAWVLRDGVELLSPVDDIDIGDQVVLHAGESVPVDGEIQEGLIGVDRRALTGGSTLVVTRLVR